MRLARDHLTADGPRVVLLHAGVADRRAWRDVAPELHAMGADVLAYDRRGFGETPASAEPFRHVDDLLGLLDGPAWLVGNSMGGAIALDAALLAPDAVAGLVLIAPAVSGAPEDAIENLDPDTRRIVAGDHGRRRGGRHRCGQPPRGAPVARRTVVARGPGPRRRARAGTRDERGRAALRRRGGRRGERRRRMVAPRGDPRSGDGRLGRARRAGRPGRLPRARAAPRRRPSGGPPSRAWRTCPRSSGRTSSSTSSPTRRG